MDEMYSRESRIFLVLSPDVEVYCDALGKWRVRNLVAGLNFPISNGEATILNRFSNPASATESGCSEQVIGHFVRIGVLVDSRYAACRTGHVYDLLAARIRDPRLVFLNYGYAEGTYAPELNSDTEYLTYPLQLIRRVLRGVELTGRVILDVGSGRGGACAYLSASTQAEKAIGLDYSAGNVAFSNTIHRHPRSCFLHSVAHALPLADNSVDVVFSIESVHLFRKVDKFLREVARVLKPGGVFRCADYVTTTPDGLDSLSERLRECGLTVVAVDDISHGVLSAMRRGRSIGVAFHESMLRGGFGGKELHDDLVKAFDRMLTALEKGEYAYGLWDARPNIVQ